MQFPERLENTPFTDFIKKRLYLRIGLTHISMGKDDNAQQGKAAATQL